MIDRRIAGNRELITKARRDQLRHAQMIREAQRKIDAGLALIRRALR